MVIDRNPLVRWRIDSGDLGSESWVHPVAEQKALPFGNCLHDLGWRGEVEGDILRCGRLHLAQIIWFLLPGSVAISVSCRDERGEGLVCPISHRLTVANETPSRSEVQEQD